MFTSGHPHRCSIDRTIQPLSNHTLRMRRNITLVAFLITICTQAQVTLTAGLLPTGTFTDRLYMVTSQGQSATPTPGANQTWDLSTATLLDIGTFTHRPAAGTPYAATYAQAELAWHLDMGLLGQNYTYLDLGTTSLDMLATDVPTDPNVYTDPLRVLQFPLSLGQSFTDSWAGSSGSGSVTWTYAGHGTAITPAGTFSNVVMLVSGTNELGLWRTSPLVPLLLVRDGVMLAVGPAMGVGVEERTSAHLAVHPVPCSDRLLVQTTAAAPWRIMDLQGRLAVEGRFQRVGAQVVDTESLRPGAYVLVQLGEGAQRVARFIKE